MERRSDKYENKEKTPQRNSRVQKNKCLYEEMNSKIGFEEIANFESNTEIDLSTLNMQNPSREEYQKIKEYKNLLGERKEPQIQKIEKDFKPKTFDINIVLEEAKKNRKTIDEKEQKRNLKNEEYSVLSNLNKKYLHKKNFGEDDDGELKELINTIASKTLANDIKDEEEKDLLSELLATTIDIKLESELSKEEINKLYQADTGEENEEKEELENSFYTKSLELSKEDLFGENEMEDEEEENKKGNGIKIAFLTIILLLLLAVVVYFILKHLGITFN